MRTTSALAPLFAGLSRFESWAHSRPLSQVPLDRPLYICGIARAGTTITLEMLSQHPDLGTHQYKDLLLPFVPIWWDRVFPIIRSRGLEKPVDRPHRDRIKVTSYSPEALEEMIWMHFFPGLHDQERCGVLDERTSNPAFERFYAEHIRKLLVARGRRRYATKNNYLTTRLAYLVRAVPDARVLLLVRNPVNHIASLMKQHRLFHQLVESEPRQLLLIRIAGHYEFGPYRVCTNLGDYECVREICECWRSGHEARGWALQWAAIYDFISEQIERDPAVRRACHLVRYEDLCEKPEQVIAGMLSHAELPLASFRPVLEEYRDKLSKPTYYQPDFTAQELEEIAEAAGPTARRLGYGAW